MYEDEIEKMHAEEKNVREIMGLRNKELGQKMSSWKPEFKH